MVTPWTFTMTSRRERPDPPRSCSRRAPMSTRRVAHRSRPYPPDCGRSILERRNNAGSSRTPSHPARRTRTIWQCWPVPALSGLLPPTPAPSGAGCPQLHRPATTGSAVAVSHLHSNISASWRTDAGIKLSSVASDLLGVSGRRMLAALVAGTTDPEVLAELAKGQLRRKLPALRAALCGRFTGHHALIVGEILAKLDYLDEVIGRLSTEIEKVIAPFEPQVQLLRTIPGVDRRTAEGLLAEIGVDMSRFGSAERLASRARLCPGAHESAGKTRSGRTRPGSKWLHTYLSQAAKAAGRSKDTYLAAQYTRLRGRRGAGKATVAVEHSILVAAFHMLDRGQPYQDLGADYFQRRRSPQHQARKLIGQLTALGYQVTAIPPTEAA